MPGLDWFTVQLVRDFPLFPLGLVALPSELVPLHIFEERYKAMIARCLEEESEFGIVWLADDGLRPIGCACEIAEVLERMPDGRINLVARGTRLVPDRGAPGRAAYPAGTVEFLADRDEERRPAGRRGRPHRLRRPRRAGHRPARPSSGEIERDDAPTRWRRRSSSGSTPSRACSTCARSRARMKLVARLCRAAIKRLDFIDRAAGPRALQRQGPLHGLSSARVGLAGHVVRGLAAVVGGERVRAVLEQQRRRARRRRCARRLCSGV